MSSVEQRELLRLLSQNFEYEMKTIELQADIFSRDYSIKHKDLQLLRMSQHRSLCDTLIYQQRRLIQGKKRRKKTRIKLSFLIFMTSVKN